MAAAERNDRYFILVALIWAAIGGALIGGLCLTAIFILDGSAYGIYENPWLAPAAPIMFAAFSLFVVVPCTLAFGLPSAVMIEHFAFRKWAALATCIANAFIVQSVCIWLLFWDEYYGITDFLFTTPFAMGAAVVLWWRLTRP